MTTPLSRSEGCPWSGASLAVVGVQAQTAAVVSALRQLGWTHAEAVCPEQWRSPRSGAAPGRERRGGAHRAPEPGGPRVVVVWAADAALTTELIGAAQRGCAPDILVAAAPAGAGTYPQALRRALQAGADDLIEWGEAESAEQVAGAIHHALLGRRHLLRPPGPDLRIQALGKEELWVAGRPVRCTGRAREVLVFMAERGGLSRRQAAEIWPELEGEARDNALRLSISRLRQCLGADMIVRQGGHYRLNPSKTLAYDVRELLGCAQTIAEHPEGNALAAGDLLQRIRPFAPSLQAPWADDVRQRLEAAERSLLKIAAEGALEYAPGRASSWARRALDLDPLDQCAWTLLEESHRRLGEPRRAELAARRSAWWRSTP